RAGGGESRVRGAPGGAVRARPGPDQSGRLSPRARRRVALGELARQPGGVRRRAVRAGRERDLGAARAPERGDDPRCARGAGPAPGDHGAAARRLRARAPDAGAGDRRMGGRRAAVLGGRPRSGGAGRPIPIVNTDPAMLLLLDTVPPQRVRGLLQPVLWPYPWGLFVDGLGPLVANDAYAAPAVWRAFGRDPYHSPAV